VEAVLLVVLALYACALGAAIADLLRAGRATRIPWIVLFPGVGLLFWLAERLARGRRGPE